MKIKLLTTVILLALWGCASQPIGPDFRAAIVGSWDGPSLDVVDHSIWTFTSDGDVFIVLGDDPEVGISINQKYEFEDDDTIIFPEEGGRRDVSMPDDDTLILTAPDAGDVMTLTRRPEQ